MDNVMQIATSPVMWIMAGIVVVLVLLEVVLFVRLSYKTAESDEVALDRTQCHKALRYGMIAAMGPATGIFVVVIALISVFGGPIAWLRLSVIGGTGTEMMCGMVGVEAAGGVFGQTLTLEQLVNALWAMTINACGWLIVVMLFANRMDKIRNKLAGGGSDSKWTGIFSTAASIGVFGVLCGSYFIDAVMLVDIDWGIVAAIFVSIGAMVVIQLISRKWKAIGPHAIGISMVAGIVAGIAVG